jgi:hypothetical protein
MTRSDGCVFLASRRYGLRRAGTKLPWDSPGPSDGPWQVVDTTRRCRSTGRRRFGCGLDWIESLASHDSGGYLGSSLLVFHDESNGEGHTTVLARFLSAKRSAYKLPSLLNFAKQWPGTGPLDASILLPINGFQSSSFYLRKGPFNSSLLPGGVVVVAGVSRGRTYGSCSPSTRFRGAFLRCFARGIDRRVGGFLSSSTSP